jgi:hypothetical protein
VNNRDNGPNPRIATLHCAIVRTTDSQESKAMNDNTEDFSWRETDAVVVRQQDAIEFIAIPMVTL